MPRFVAVCDRQRGGLCARRPLVRFLRTGRWERPFRHNLGPFCIIYGVGAVAVYLLSAFLKNRGRSFFAVCGFHRLRRGGRILRQPDSGDGPRLRRLGLQRPRAEHRRAREPADGAAVGRSGVLFMRLLFPLLSRLFAKMRGKGWRVACVCVSVFMAVNLLVTAAAVTGGGRERKARRPQRRCAVAGRGV